MERDRKNNGNRKLRILEEEAISLEEDMTMEEKQRLKERVWQRMERDSGNEESRRGHLVQGDGGGFVSQGRLPGRWHGKLWKEAAAAVLLAMLIPAGVYAYGKIQQYFHVSVSKNGYQVEMPITASEETRDMLSVVDDVKPVHLVLEGLPEYKKHCSDNELEMYEQWLYKGEPYDNVMQCCIIKVDKEVEREFMETDVAHCEEIEIDGHKSLYLKYNNVLGSRYADRYFGQELYIFYDDLGYILRCYNDRGNEESSQQDMIDFARKIKLEVCTKDQADSTIDLTAYMKQKKEEEEPEKRRTPAGEQIYSRRNVVEWDACAYHVMDVRVTDSVKGLLQEDGRCFRNKERLRKCTDKKGRLISYRRETVQRGDGKSQPGAKVIEEKDVQLMYVEVMVQVKNISGNDIWGNMNQQLSFLREENAYKSLEDEGKVYIRPDKVLDAMQGDIIYEPIYFRERLKKDKNFSGYMELKDRETQFFHLGYLVDEDQLDQMYLRLPWGTAAELDKYIDIRQ